jgi:hypothetical protein
MTKLTVAPKISNPHVQYSYVYVATVETLRSNKIRISYEHSNGIHVLLIEKISTRGIWRALSEQNFREGVKFL